MTIAAKVKVPFWPVPVTLQTLAVPFMAAAFGSRLALATMIAYLAAGFVGVPVFANTPPSSAGPFYFFGPTGGYLLAYPLAAWIIGKVSESEQGRSLPALLVAMIIGNSLVLAIGACWLAWVALPSGGFSGAWTVGVVPFLLPELVKVGLAGTSISLMWRTVKREDWEQGHPQ